MEKLPGNGRVTVSCGEGGCTTYRFHIFGRAQQKGSDCKLNFVGFGEGPLEPSHHRKKFCQGDVCYRGALYQSGNVSRKMLSKNKLTTTCMRKTDTVASYLVEITELIRDQIAAVRDTFEVVELVWISMNGFSPLCHNFVQVSYDQEKLLDFEQLWDVCICLQFQQALTFSLCTCHSLVFKSSYERLYFIQIGTQIILCF